jgi:hypothetical protein
MPLTIGAIRHKRAGRGFACPRCGSVNTIDEPQTGYCPRCQAFTGKCAIGWQVACAGQHHGDGSHAVMWHSPCREARTTRRNVSLAGQRAEIGVCAAHDAALSAAGAPPMLALMAGETLPAKPPPTDRAGGDRGGDIRQPHGRSGDAQRVMI